MEKGKLISENPTPDEVKKLMEEQEMLANEIAKKETKLLETYLLEYCEVNGVKETDLKELLAVGVFPQDNSTVVFNVNDKRDVKIGVKYYSEYSPTRKAIVQGFTVSGEFMEEKDKYPKTAKYLEEISNE